MPQNNSPQEKYPASEPGPLDQYAITLQLSQMAGLHYHSNTLKCLYRQNQRSKVFRVNKTRLVCYEKSEGELVKQHINNERNDTFLQLPGIAWCLVFPVLNHHSAFCHLMAIVKKGQDKCIAIQQPLSPLPILPALWLVFFQAYALYLRKFLWTTYVKMYAIEGPPLISSAGTFSEDRTGWNMVIGPKNKKQPVSKYSGIINT